MAEELQRPAVLLQGRLRVNQIVDVSQPAPKVLLFERSATRQFGRRSAGAITR